MNERERRFFSSSFGVLLAKKICYKKKNFSFVYCNINVSQNPQKFAPL